MVKIELIMSQSGSPTRAPHISALPVRVGARRAVAKGVEIVVGGISVRGIAVGGVAVGVNLDYPAQVTRESGKVADEELW